MRGRDERAIVRRPRENDVARLVTDEERPDDARPVPVADVDDAHRVGQVVDDPDFVVRVRGDGHGLEADFHGAERLEAAPGDAEDFEAIVGRVGGVKELAVGRQRERSNLEALEKCVGIVTLRNLPHGPSLKLVVAIEGKGFTRG